MDSGIVEVRFDGKRYSHWQQADVRASVDDLCASVRLSVSLPGIGEELSITPNTVIDVLMDGQSVTHARVDSFSRRVGKDDHEMHLEARSLGRELVDCQYSRTLSGLALGEIAQRLCADFKVPLKITAPTAVVPEFAMECESPATALINAVRTANLLLYPTPDGGLILTQPSSAAPVATLTYGKHLLDYNVVDEYRLRYSEYCVKGYDYEENSPTQGRVRDSGVSFYRPLHLMADKQGKLIGGCTRRAQLEMSRRLARAHRIELSVVGWRYKDSQGQFRVWDINTQVHVVIPQEGIDQVFLIGDRSFRLDGRGGHITRLTVMRREAYAGIAPKKSVKKKPGAKK